MIERDPSLSLAKCQTIVCWKEKTFSTFLFFPSLLLFNSADLEEALDTHTFISNSGGFRIKFFSHLWRDSFYLRRLLSQFLEPLHSFFFFFLLLGGWYSSSRFMPLPRPVDVLVHAQKYCYCYKCLRSMLLDKLHRPTNSYVCTNMGTVLYKSLFKSLNTISYFVFC